MAGSGVHLHRFHSGVCPGFAISDGQGAVDSLYQSITQVKLLRYAVVISEVFRHQVLLAQRGFYYKPCQLQYIRIRN